MRELSRTPDPMQVDLNLFKNNYLVAGLNVDQVKQVADLAELCFAERNQEIVSLGSRDPDLYVILEGEVVVYRDGGVVLGERGPGSVIGEVSLVDDLPRSAYVLAKGNLTYAKLDGKALRRYMFQNKDAGFIMLSNLARVLSMRLRGATELIEDLQGQIADADPWRFAQ